MKMTADFAFDTALKKHVFVFFAKMAANSENNT